MKLFRLDGGGERDLDPDEVPEILESSYEILKVNASASLEEIRQSYEHLIFAWNPERFADNPEWKTRAEAKLEEIHAAYEKILASHEARRSGPPEGAATVNFDEPQASFPPREEAAPLENKARVYIVYIAAGVALLLFAVFIWPTIYHHDSMKVGDENYPSRMNRITGKLSYFDGGKWNPAPAMPLDAVSSLETPAVSTPGSTSASPVSADAKAEPVKDAESPVKAAPPAEPSGAPVLKDKPYAVQLGAVRDGEKARAIVNDLKRGGFDAHMMPVIVRDQGTLHRICIGRFATKEEALRHMRENKISDNHPGCFVQKITP